MSVDFLSELGVSGDLLSEVEKTALDERGYVLLGKLLSDADLEAIRERVQELLQREGDSAGSELANSPHIRYPKEEGADRLANLANKGPVFDRLYLHPRLLAAVSHILPGEFRLSSLNFRSAKPGAGSQKLHVDWKFAVPPGDFRVCNSIWMLDDFTASNGATRLVPGSHLRGKMPEDELADPWGKHEHEILLEAPAGTVCVFNAHVWHAGTTNRTDRPRRAIHSYYCRADQPQQTDQKYFLTQETRDRVSQNALRLLGV